MGLSEEEAVSNFGSSLPDSIMSNNAEQPEQPILHPVFGSIDQPFAFPVRDIQTEQPTTQQVASSEASFESISPESLICLSVDLRILRNHLQQIRDGYQYAQDANLPLHYGETEFRSSFFPNLDADSPFDEALRYWMDPYKRIVREDIMMAEAADQEVLAFLKDKALIQFWYRHYLYTADEAELFDLDREFHPLQIPSGYGLPRIVQTLLAQINAKELAPGTDELLQDYLEKALVYSHCEQTMSHLIEADIKHPMAVLVLLHGDRVALIQQYLSMEKKAGWELSIEDKWKTLTHAVGARVEKSLRYLLECWKDDARELGMEDLAAINLDERLAVTFQVVPRVSKVEDDEQK